ncbi:PTS sugar transporter subunit IIC [Entomospira culicis]|uniref:Permease IIC component n=1 Tax=Entomospira culicis TaxID=2719989 RepID=A0A968GKK5_9SPIO|nr:PTS transporter subunit EIIC [Entomospira culicis]NIZ19545.1 PTS sugar transporter subunit IIC [Entomospira culicis]NIZ69550.1 PTS sugar transporter subunit IIC [Entomospira culicis]WDI36661.1 PTS transporter subunit EIIC [Entomospira culicis]WDI38290.1 PTS transporter subunit EIIC [Entomospira culicis]
MSDALMENKFIQVITKISMKVGQQRHLSAIKESFILVMPLFLMAGLAVMVSFALLPMIIKENVELLTKLQGWGAAINNGTLQISALLIAPSIGYILAKNAKFEGPLVAGIVSLASFVMLSPSSVSYVDANGIEQTIGGVLNFGDIGSNGLIGGIVVGLIASEVLMFFAKMNLKIKLGPDVPSGVARSFEVLLPILITLSLLSLGSLLLQLLTGKDLMQMIVFLIQTPLSKVNNSILGLMLLFGMGIFLFSLGIHHTVIRAPFVDPIMTANMNENTLAFANGQAPEHILTGGFIDIFAQMGGAGATISLVIAMILFTKHKNSNQLGKLSLAPALFNINEPIIFGYPIVYNLPLMIPFVLIPLFNMGVGYILMRIGIVPLTVVAVPWTTPPIFSGVIATQSWIGGAVQAVLIAINVMMYLPFMKISENIERKMAQQSQ